MEDFSKYIVVTEEERKRWTVIEDVNTWKVQVPSLHPDSVKYTKFWREVISYSIDGFWGKDFGKYRFMPPKLFYYINFFIIIYEENGKAYSKTKPKLRDLDWEIFYMFFVAKGFSGFKDDDKYSCNNDILDYQKGLIKIEDLHLSCINMNGKVKEYIDPLTYCRMLHEKPQGKPLYLNTPKNVMLFGSRSSGKLLLPTAKIRIKDGWTTMQDIQPGDLVYGLDGKLCPVTYKTELQKNVNMYELTFSDGRKIKSCEDHLWYVWDKNNAIDNQFAYITKPTKELYATYKQKNESELRYAIPINNALLEETEKSLPLHPYLFGVLLSNSEIIGENVVIASEDIEIINKVESLLPDGYNLKATDKYSYIISRKDDSFKPFIYYLNDLGLSYKKSEYKFIPDIYKFNSYENKLELIKGLMDTNGICDNKNSIQYYTPSKQLSDDFQEILRSIGINCKTTIMKSHYIQKNGVKNTNIACFKSTVFTNQPIFSLERKLSYINQEKDESEQSKYEKSFIVNIEPCGTDEGYCISVDNPTNTYITDDYIVTHNTYSISGIHLHEILFAGELDSKSYFDKKPLGRLDEAGLCIGAAKSDKSEQFFKYMAETMRQYSFNPELGAWGQPGEDDYEPSPLYRNMVGELKSNNVKSVWRDEYKVRTDSGEIIKGSRSFAKHVNYKDNSEAAASGRYSYNTIEEIGLLENAPTAWISNEFTTSFGTKKVGSLVGLGTSGVIEKVEGAKEIFLNPFKYNLVPYKDFLEGNGENGYTGFFIPAYMIDMKYKDANGNTDILSAKKAAWEKLESVKDNPIAFRGKCMHAPLLISHMWINPNGNLLPAEEARLREKELLVNNLYEELATPVELFYNPNSKTGVDYKINYSLKPITNPFKEADQSESEGCIVIYKFPEFINVNRIYEDQYFYVHDPYASDYTGKSLGVTYVISNPKYISEGLSGNEIVASYIGKHPNGKEGYNSELEKLIQFYGNCRNMLWYEANRGDDVRNYFIRKNKVSILALRPQLAKGSAATIKQQNQYGFYVGDKTAKLQMISNFSEWLLEDLNNKKIISYIPCLYLIRQIQLFNLKENENFDGISAMLGYPLALKEFQTAFINEVKKKSNPLSHLIQNSLINNGKIR